MLRLERPFWSFAIGLLKLRVVSGCSTRALLIDPRAVKEAHWDPGEIVTFDVIEAARLSSGDLHAAPFAQTLTNCAVSMGFLRNS
jgi:hypothetical protein